MLSDDQVRHIAKLARIKLSDVEVSKFSKQLSDVLDYMEILSDVDTDDIQETSQVTGLLNVMEKDEIVESQCDRKELLDCSELSVDSDQIRIIRVVK